MSGERVFIPSDSIQVQNTRSRESSRNSERRLIHNCGISGFYFFNPPEDFIDPLRAQSRLQHRGQEGTKFVAIQRDGEVDTWSSKELLKHARDREDFQTFTQSVAEKGRLKIAIGHNRYSTSGALDATQPFVDDDLVTAHNGNIINPLEIVSDVPYFFRQDLKSDTDALHRAIRYADGETTDEKIKNTLPKVKLSYSLILADPSTQTLYGISDPWKNRPLFIGKLNDGNGYMFASEEYALEGKADVYRPVRPGEGIRIRDNKVETFYQDPRKVERASCIFENIYFAWGKDNAPFRRACGAELAREDFKNGFIPETVIGVQNSGSLAGEGYFQEMKNLLIDAGMLEELKKLQYASGLIQNKNSSGRTFIAPGGREERVDDKFDVDPTVVQDRKVVTIDDSQVRGFTARTNNQKLRVAGAREVHNRFASPPVRHPCYMGIDMATYEELLAVGKTIQEIAHLINSDSVGYLPMQKTEELAKEYSKEPGIKFCNACFTGEYPEPIKKELLLQKHEEAALVA